LLHQQLQATRKKAAKLPTKLKASCKMPAIGKQLTPFLLEEAN